MAGDQAFQTRLVSQLDNPISAVDNRFIYPYEAHLKIREKKFSFSGGDFEIIDPWNGYKYFLSEGRVSSNSKKTLLDIKREPVLNMKTGKNEFLIYAGNNSDKLIFKFICRTNNSLVSKAKLYATFNDVKTGEERVMVLKSDRSAKDAFVYLGEPKQRGQMVAKVHRPLTWRGNFTGAEEYIVDIAAGVDISLIVMLCIALDEHKSASIFLTT